MLLRGVVCDVRGGALALIRERNHEKVFFSVIFPISYGRELRGPKDVFQK